jgi:hypothetical protein
MMYPGRAAKIREFPPQDFNDEACGATSLLSSSSELLVGKRISDHMDDLGRKFCSPKEDKV